MKSFTATAFQRKPADIFNAVQADSSVVIESNSRPSMVLMLESERCALIEKVKQLTELIKAQPTGDKHKQQDLLKG